MADILRELVKVMVVMLLSLTVHEYAHARTAFWLGDDTASRQGRLTLNPLAHIDLFGSILLPVIAILSQSGFFFGWARPVPVTPVRFTRNVRMKTGMLLTALAGPLSNLLLAALLSFVLWVLFRLNVLTVTVADVLDAAISLNVVLALFNLLPVPPLDGSKVLIGLLPDRFSRQLRWVEERPQMTFLAFLVVIYFAGPLLAHPVHWLVSLLRPSGL